MRVLESITEFLKSFARLLFNVYVIILLLVLILSVALYRLMPIITSPPPPESNKELILEKQEQLKTVTAHLKNARENGNLENILNFELDSVRIEQEIYDLRNTTTTKSRK